MIMLKVTKKPVLHPLSEKCIFRKPQMGGQICPPLFLGLRPSIIFVKSCILYAFY